MSDRIARLKEFLKDSPNDSFLNHALALEYVKIEDDRAAKDVFEQNLAQHPDYVATYYHLAKLLERLNETKQALDIYERGMAIAKAANDMHSYSELQSAYEDLAY
ncbi:MAG: hypothetical protein JST70_14130 [Bacteroidetes bacterium]|nr:hypothetical protein [Bacteroidota bacterium]